MKIVSSIMLFHGIRDNSTEPARGHPSLNKHSDRRFPARSKASNFSASARRDRRPPCHHLLVIAGGLPAESQGKMNDKSCTSESLGLKLMYVETSFSGR